MEGLRLGSIGLALTYDIEIPQDITFTPLVSLPTYVLLSAENPLSQKDTISMRELEGEPFVQFDYSPARELALSLFHQEGMRPNIAYKSRQIMSIQTMVGNNFGFSFVNIRPRVEFALDGSKLVTIPLETSLPPLVLGIATIEHPFIGHSMEVFKNYCCEQISKRSIPGALIPGSTI